MNFIITAYRHECTTDNFFTSREKFFLAMEDAKYDKPAILMIGKGTPQKEPYAVDNNHEHNPSPYCHISALLAPPSLSFLLNFSLSITQETVLFNENLYNYRQQANLGNCNAYFSLFQFRTL